MQTEVVDRVIKLGGTAEILDNKARWAWTKRWRAIYAEAVHRSTGHWTLNGFDLACVLVSPH